jgi:hypothetical protein
MIDSIKFAIPEQKYEAVREKSYSEFLAAVDWKQNKNKTLDRTVQSELVCCLRFSLFLSLKRPDTSRGIPLAKRHEKFQTHRDVKCRFNDKFQHKDSHPPKACSN